MPDGLGASTRVTSGSRSAVRGMPPNAGSCQVLRGSTGAFTRGTLAPRRPSAPAQVDAAGAQPRHRVGVAAVHDAAGVHLEVQVRPGRLAPVPDLGDHLAGPDPLPRP